MMHETHDETTARPSYGKLCEKVKDSNLSRLDLARIVASIWHTLNGKEWSMDECEYIAETLTTNGFPILDPNEVDDA